MNGKWKTAAMVALLAAMTALTAACSGNEGEVPANDLPAGGEVEVPVLGEDANAEDADAQSEDPAAEEPAADETATE